MTSMANRVDLEALRGTVIIGADGRDDVIRLINHQNYVGAAVEVGTWTGLFSERLLRETKIESLACVDPYQSYDAFKDAINFVDLEAIFREASGRLAPFGQRVRFIREFSRKGVEQVEDESLDFVYIDGNHGYDYVSEDIALWWPKVRLGGILIGDDCIDYDDEARDQNHNVTIVHTRKADGSPEWYGDYGVFYAVREFCQQNGLDFSTLGTQFVIPK